MTQFKSEYIIGKTFSNQNLFYSAAAALNEW